MGGIPYDFVCPPLSFKQARGSQQLNYDCATHLTHGEWIPGYLMACHMSRARTRHVLALHMCGMCKYPSKTSAAACVWQRPYTSATHTLMI